MAGVPARNSGKIANKSLLEERIIPAVEDFFVGQQNLRVASWVEVPHAPEFLGFLCNE